MSCQGAPKVQLRMPKNREYANLLTQTAIVYNRLLEDKYDKLLDGILRKKLELDSKCDELAAQDEDKALEFAVKAQDELIQLQNAANAELGALHRDYQKKLIKMQQQLEQRWKTERLEKANHEFKLLRHNGTETAL